MKNVCPLFPERQPEKSCAAYEHVWKGVNDCCRSVRDHCEDLWKDYRELADKDFLFQFPQQFHQRWFEMYLTVSLIRAGISVECKKPGPKGPDVLVMIEKRRVWIEAVCAGGGQLGKPDRVPEIERGVVGEVPMRQYVLRLRNSLGKKAGQFQNYIDDGIVAPDDLAVIAINVGGIPFLGADMDECIKRSIYGIGDMIVSLDRATGRRVGINRENKSSAFKSSGAAVEVQSFTDGSMAHISAVLGSSENAFNLCEERGQGFILYPNLTSFSQWPHGLVTLGREWIFKETGDGWTGMLR